MNIKLSVIIPIYNSEKFLARCINSIINQTLKPIEIICIDDCSTDNSFNILTELKNKNDQLIIVKNKERLGAGESRNIGIKIANGEFIHFLDADDTIVDNIYEKIYFSAKNNKLDILRTKSYLIDNNTGIIKLDTYNSLSKIDINKFNKVISFLEDPELFIHGIQVAPWAGIYNRIFLKENNIKFNNLMCVNDRSFFAETLFKAKRIMFLDVYVVRYTINNNKSLIGLRDKYFDCHFKSYSIIKEKSVCLPDDIRKKYLICELYDMIHWLITKSSSEYKKDIIDKTKLFLIKYKNSDCYSIVIYYFTIFCIFCIKNSFLENYKKKILKLILYYLGRIHLGNYW